MMKETTLSRSVRLLCASGLLVGLGCLTQPALAQQDGDAAPMQRVEVTGSSIKRLAAETANPLTVIKAEEFIKQGLTTAQEVLTKIPSNNAGMGSGNAIGGNKSGLPTGGQASADLRGLGDDKTLVLLNGRRIANHPYSGASVDLNIIPISALDRIEVLRDGASSIYGTDAIGGVINFITKRSVNATTVTAETVHPEHSGGAERRFNLSSGMGKLDTDGWNAFGVIDYHHQDVLTSQQRSFSQTGVHPEHGTVATSGTTFPANFFFPGVPSTVEDAPPLIPSVTGNPGYATGCLPPDSVPNRDPDTKTCRQDYSRRVDNLPRQRQISLFGKGSLKLGGDHLATIEYLHSENKVVSRTAPSPQIELALPYTSQYYPGNSGGVPAYPGLVGLDGAPPVPLSVNWRPVEAGQRQIDSIGKADRLLLAMEGVLGGWDYKTGLTHSISKSAEEFTGGYVRDSTFAAGVREGILNPFGEQTAAGKAYLASTALRGQEQNAKVTTTSIDAKASRDLIAMGGGQLALAVGAELRHEKADFNVNRDIAGESSGSGLSGSRSTAGKRNIEAVFAELNLPFSKQLEVNTAVRFDNYNDVGNTTNPKVAIRYQPSTAVLIRGSASTGFRAPTLYEKNAPPSRNDTNNSYNDPFFCPGGKVLTIPAANKLRDCDLQQFKLQGGNSNLTPEKSKTFSLGTVIEPSRNLTLSIDYWNIKIKDKIGYLPEQTIFAQFTKYQGRFLRNADGSPNAILDMNENLGKVNTDGVDLSVNFALPRTSYGNFSFSLDGTYVHKYEYQNERDGAFTQNVGVYGDNNPVFRWKHTASASWAAGPWSATLSQSFKAKYTDQNLDLDGPEFNRDVSSYSLWSLSGNYTGFKGVTLTAGLKNLFDKEPPYSNQGTMFQQGYDPRYTDPIGRALYLRGSYTF
ncbi:MAG: TonB-dependent receptor [Pseudomonadota bacterium]